MRLLLFTSLLLLLLCSTEGEGRHNSLTLASLTGVTCWRQNARRGGGGRSRLVLWMEVNGGKCELELSSQCSLWSATYVRTAVTPCATRNRNVEHQLCSARLLRTVSRRSPLRSSASSASSWSSAASSSSAFCSCRSSLFFPFLIVTFSVLFVYHISSDLIHFFCSNLGWGNVGSTEVWCGLLSRSDSSG